MGAAAHRDRCERGARCARGCSMQRSAWMRASCLPSSVVNEPSTTFEWRNINNKRRESCRSIAGAALASQTEAGNDVLIALGSGVFQIVEQFAALIHHLEQAAA